MPCAGQHTSFPEHVVCLLQELFMSFIIYWIDGTYWTHW